MMLSHIYIKNFAIVREIDIDLEPGFNIITGETGTGKSVVIQAVSTALGGRGSASLVAKGCDKALVQLIFTLTPEERKQILSGFDDILEDEEEELILSRDFHASGKSIARVNGRIVNLSVLSRIASVLIDIHGQYDNQKLLDPDTHMDILDRFAGPELLAVKQDYSTAYDNYMNVRRTLGKLRKEHSEYLRRQDFLRYELEEITSASLIPGEEEELTKRLAFLQNGEKIYSGLSGAYDILYENPLDRCVSFLSGISQYSPVYASYLESVQNCRYTLEDVCGEIRRSRDEVTFEPSEIEEILIRLDMLDRLKRKYGETVEKILEYRDRTAAELETYENIDDRENDLKNQMKASFSIVDALSSKLTQMRTDAALRLSEEMTSQLTELNFRNVQFDVSIRTAADPSGKKLYSPQGCDTVEFFFNANKGAELKPLASVASGGEISRISLAFKCLADVSESSRTMIFDEIDTGISGITASVVGRKMSQLGQSHQILCITHLPQIAAAGDHQYQISKDEDDDSSYTTIRKLDDAQRVAEIARLLGGANVTKTTLASAEELLADSRYAK